MSFDVDRLRASFKTLLRKTYFQNGGYGLLSNEGKAAIERYLADRLEEGAAWEAWGARQERIRGKIARLFSVESYEIALTASASAGINSIASALDFSSSRDKVVVSDFEFPTSAQIWHAQELRGARVEHVPETADGLIPLEHFERAIDERTKLVAIADICYRTGARLDIAGVVRIAHARGALVLLDCFQSAGVQHIDLRSLDVDTAVGGMSKYLLGSAGIAYLYVKAEITESLVPTVSGMYAQAEPGAMDVYHNLPAPDARRFQQGTPSMPSLYASEAGLDTILELGTTDIEAYVLDLSGRCMDRLGEADIPTITPRPDNQRGAMVCIPSKDATALVGRLAEANIVTSSRDGNVRVMFHAYNNDADVDRLIEVLEMHRELLPGVA
jgi:selenocysteine lyase/cysteine desulfurase